MLLAATAIGEFTLLCSPFHCVSALPNFSTGDEPTLGDDRNGSMPLPLRQTNNMIQYASMRRSPRMVNTIGLVETTPHDERFFAIVWSFVFNFFEFCESQSKCSIRLPPAPSHKMSMVGAGLNPRNLRYTYNVPVLTVMRCARLSF